MGAQWKQKWRELNADRKGKIVGKLVKEIHVSVKMGGPNPEYNARLSAALEAARRQSVTRDTIERAIKKGSGQGADAVTYETLLFEGFAPHRVPVMVECLTDNHNRTAPELRVLFRAGSLGAKGSVAWMFDRIGLIEATHDDKNIDPEMAALEAEADTVELQEPEEGEHHAAPPALSAKFHCAPTALDEVTRRLKAAGWKISVSELSYHPKDTPSLTEAQHEEVAAFLQHLDDHEDVHRLHVAFK